MLTNGQRGLELAHSTPDNKIEEPDQQLTQSTKWDLEDTAVVKEEELDNKC